MERFLLRPAIRCSTLWTAIPWTQLVFTFWMSSFLANAWADTARTASRSQRQAELPSHATTVEAFAPPGWRLETTALGDLNRDGRPDVAFVLRLNNPANIWHDRHQRIRPSVDANPRWFGVALARGSGFALVSQSQSLVARHSEDYLSDPLGNLSIEQGDLMLDFESFPMIGSGHVSNSRMVFRLKGKCLRLITYEDDFFHRYAAERHRLHIDFQTGQQRRFKATSEGVPFRLVSENTLKHQPICLDAVGEGLSFRTRLIELKEFL